MRSTAYSLLAAVLLATATSAFKDSSPLLIWSSTEREALRDARDELTSGVISASEMFRTIQYLGCEWDRVVVVHMDELHQSHVPALKIGSSSPADLHVPYLINPLRSTLDEAVEEWAEICGADISTTDVGGEGGKRIIRIEGGKSTMDGEALQNIPKGDLTILTGTRAATKRQSPEEPERPFATHTSTSTHRRPTHTSTTTASHPSKTHGNSSLPSKDAPLFERVQILTTPIITALLISLLIFVPVVMFGVSALAGIQVPPRMLEIGKGMTIGKDKKDQ